MRFPLVLLFLLLATAFATTPTDGTVTGAIQRLQAGQNDPQVIAVLERASEQRNAEAMTALGFCYANGRGVPRDEARARALFEEAFSLGSPTAATNLGAFLIRGRGGEPDLARGVRVLRDSARSGSQASSLLLAEIFMTGEHNAASEPDFLEAANLVRPLAESGNSAAQNMIGLLLKDGRLPESEKEEAGFWLEQSANQGNAKAAFNLVDFWGLEAPCPRARIEALKWLMVSAQSGDVFAIRLYLEKKSRFDSREEAVAEKLAGLFWKHVRKMAAPELPLSDP